MWEIFTQTVFCGWKPSLHWSPMLSQPLMCVDLWQLLCVSDIDIIVTIINDSLLRVWFRGLGQKTALLLPHKREIAHWCEETWSNSYITQALTTKLQYQKVLVPPPLSLMLIWISFTAFSVWNYEWINCIFIYLGKSLLCWLWYSALSALHNYISLLLQHQIDCPRKWTWLCYKLHLWIIRNVLFCLK